MIHAGAATALQPGRTGRSPLTNGCPPQPMWTAQMGGGMAPLSALDRLAEGRVPTGNRVGGVKPSRLSNPTLSAAPFLRSARRRRRHWPGIGEAPTLRRSPVAVMWCAALRRGLAHSFPRNDWSDESRRRLPRRAEERLRASGQTLRERSLCRPLATVFSAPEPDALRPGPGAWRLPPMGHRTVAEEGCTDASGGVRLL